ncbi:TMEM175 family protein [Sphingomonas sp.]|uniref:TMEM175 family protein n=1 Tax=Sphingomonas sp. TaxID=28214 RepID=UPI003CC51D4E
MNESTVAHGPEHRLERLVFFSDAVFAIAITLLVIDLHVPHLRDGAPDSAYWAALADLAPQFTGFFISFYVIGFFWAGHHRTMAAASHFAPDLTAPTMMLLSAIAAVPFFTAFASNNPGTRVPVFCYCGWLLVCGLANRRLQTVVTSPPVLDPAVTPAAVAGIRRRGTAVILGAATAMTAALVVPLVAQTALATIPLWRWGLERLAGRARAADA